jgi:hypothetical protein
MPKMTQERRRRPRQQIETRDEPTKVMTLALAGEVYKRARQRIADELGESDPERVPVKLVMQQARSRYLDRIAKTLKELGFRKQAIDSIRPRRMGETTYEEFDQAAQELDVPTIALIRAALALLAGDSRSAGEES